MASNRTMYWIVPLLITIALTGCRLKQDVSTASADAAATGLVQGDFQKIDVHTHYLHDRDYLGALFSDWNMKGVSVDVVTEDDSQRTDWHEAMVPLRDAYPERILLCTSFDATKIDDPNFAADVIAQLKEHIAQGAVMVKVWKNVGMVIKDASGQYVQIDDPRFQPIWDFLVAEDIPVLAHIGEPRAAWRPLDPESPHYTYYKNHPQYHNYTRDDVPNWETIMAARDRWLARNPDLTVIGAHLGSMAYDVDEVAKRLNKYPNFYVDTAERFGDLVIQPSDAVRAFFVEYQDRILYGTDVRTTTPSESLSEQELEVEHEKLHQTYRMHWEYLTRADSMRFVKTVASFRARTRGLNLDRTVLEKFYHDNAVRLLGDRAGAVEEGSM